MYPGINPKQMQQAMKKLGLQQQEVDAKAVIIRTAKEDIVIRNPSVQKVNMMGHMTYQISGDEEIRPHETAPEISDEDIKTVMEQAGCSMEEASAAVKAANGDLAEAILSLQQNRK
jgi:nascent polypeptide-associated complex subunit alpha